MIIPRILFFDSGVGGLSVYDEVRQLLPDCHYLYCFDNAFFPFSEKSEETIIQRTLSICEKINKQYPLDLIVIACNTASTVVLPALRSKFNIPIVGTVPAIKPAARLSHTKTIGLLATKGTVKRAYVDDLINEYALDCQVEKIGSTKLVEIAEAKLHGYSVDLLALQAEVKDWIGNANLDTVILGCTHFPLLRKEIQFCLPQVKYFVDSGAAIAKRVQNLLQGLNIGSKIEINNQMFCTQPFENQEKFQKMLKLWGFDSLRLLDLDTD